MRPKPHFEFFLSDNGIDIQVNTHHLTSKGHTGQPQTSTHRLSTTSHTGNKLQKSTHRLATTGHTGNQSQTSTIVLQPRVTPVTSPKQAPDRKRSQIKRRKIYEIISTIQTNCYLISMSIHKYQIYPSNRIKPCHFRYFIPRPGRSRPSYSFFVSHTQQSRVQLQCRRKGVSSHSIWH